MILDRSSCKSCAQPLVWCTTKRGKRMPVDAAPHKDGTIFIDWAPRPFASVLYGEELRLARRKGVELHRPHFETCPKADDWRKPR